MSSQSIEYSAEVVVDFRVRAKIPSGCFMCVVGSSKELGSWDPLKAKIMKSTDMDLSQQPGIMIYKWDSQAESRCINVSELPHYHMLPTVDFCGITDTQYAFSNEWLVNTTEIRLRLVGEKPIKFFDDQIGLCAVGIKCCPIDCKDLLKGITPDTVKLSPASRNSSKLTRFAMVSAIPVSAFQKLIGPGGISKSAERLPPALWATELDVAARMTGNTNYEFTSLQDNRPVIFHNGEFLSFRTCTAIQDTLGFRFEFYRDVDGRQVFFGAAFLLPFETGLSCKLVHTPIFGLDTSCIGKLTIDSLIVKPIPGIKMDMKVSHQNHWKHQKIQGYCQGCDSYYSYSMKKIVSMKENTMASFKIALKKGVPFIQFDVQLCKDKVPIIYHDFHILVPTFQTFCKTSEFHEIGVKDLRLTTLQSAKVKKFSDMVSSMSAKEAGYNTLELFPTLRKALRTVPASLGFIIVVKYPQRLENGHMEIDDYFDHDTVVDTIITTVVTCQFTRKVMFTSENTDICILLQKKQNKFPVLYRSKALNSQYPAYTDFRSKSLEAAIYFAASEKLLGVNLLVEELVKDLKIIKKAHTAGLIVFAWSDKKDIGKEIYGSHIDAVVSEQIHFKYDRGMKREVFYLPKETGDVNYLKAHVMSGIKRPAHYVSDSAESKVIDLCCQ